MKTHEIRKLVIAEIEDASYNPRKISDDARKGLGESLNEFGLVEMPVVNELVDGFRLIGGHRRLEQLKADGYTHVDCVVVALDPADEMAANLALNSPAIRGRYDAHALSDELLAQIEADLPSPEFAGFDKMMSDLHAKSAYASAVKTEDNSADDDVKTSKTVRSKVGKVYRLGEHLLYCGEHEKGARKLFKSREKATVTITDPPYGEDYKARNGEEVKHDDARTWRDRMIQWARAIIRRSDVAYVFCSSRRLADLEYAWTDVHTSVWQWLVWVKDRPTTQFPNYRGDYHHQAEFILFGGKGDAISSSRPNVLEFPKPRQNILHPTQKPSALIRVLMEDSTEPTDLVFDPFGGSGTTLAVAEELGRRCYTCEVDPAHCDTIRRRWVQQVHGDDADWARKTPAIRSK